MLLRHHLDDDAAPQHGILPAKHPTQRTLCQRFIEAVAFRQGEACVAEIGGLSLASDTPRRCVLEREVRRRSPTACRMGELAGRSD